jgi:hypothetical protein
LGAVELNNAPADPHYERAKELDVDIRAHIVAGKANPGGRRQQERAPQIAVLRAARLTRPSRDQAAPAFDKTELEHRRCRNARRLLRKGSVRVG